MGSLYLVLAEWTGLEPATPGVTGRYSNQLNYHSFCCFMLIRSCYVLPINLEREKRHLLGA